MPQRTYCPHQQTGLKLSIHWCLSSYPAQFPYKIKTGRPVYVYWPCGLRTGSPPFPPPRLLHARFYPDGFSCGPGVEGFRSPYGALKAPYFLWFRKPSCPLQCYVTASFPPSDVISEIFWNCDNISGCPCAR